MADTRHGTAAIVLALAGASLAGMLAFPVGASALSAAHAAYPQSCISCHGPHSVPSGGQGLVAELAALHEPLPSDSDCVACHAGTLAGTHREATRATASGPVSSCRTCHEGDGPPATGAARACVTCHPGKRDAAGGVVQHGTASPTPPPAGAGPSEDSSVAAPPPTGSGNATPSVDTTASVGAVAPPPPPSDAATLTPAGSPPAPGTFGFLGDGSVPEAVATDTGWAWRMTATEASLVAGGFRALAADGGSELVMARPPDGSVVHDTYSISTDPLDAAHFDQATRSGGILSIRPTGGNADSGYAFTLYGDGTAEIARGPEFPAGGDAWPPREVMALLRQVCGDG